MVLNKQSHHASFKQTKRDLKKKRLGHRMMHGKAFWKSGIDEIAKASRDIASGPHKGAYSAPYEIPAARANVLTYVGLWSTAIKLNPSWKMEVSKSAWIKGCKWSRLASSNFQFSWLSWRQRFFLIYEMYNKYGQLGRVTNALKLTVIIRVSLKI